MEANWLNSKKKIQLVALLVKIAKSSFPVKLPCLLQSFASAKKAHYVRTTHLKPCHLSPVYLCLSGTIKNCRERTCAQLCITLWSIFRKERRLCLRNCINPGKTYILIHLQNYLSKLRNDFLQNSQTENGFSPLSSVCLLCILRITSHLKLAAMQCVKSDACGRREAVPAQHHVCYNI